MKRRRFLKYCGLAFLSTVVDTDGGRGPQPRTLLRNKEALQKIPHHITFSKPLELRVGEHFPSNLPMMSAANNLDAIKHNNQVYLALRTAPSHFASSETLLHILRSKEGLHFEQEHTIAMGADKREPRFLSMNDNLFMYFFRGGTDWTAFEPREIYVTQRRRNGWTEAKETLQKGFVPWRIRNHNGRAYMSIYDGRDVYEKGEEGKAYILESPDGLNWKERLHITEPIVSEPEFVFDENSQLWGTVRFEGQGGGIIHAKNLDSIQLKKTPHKFDSALALAHDNEVYLIARRNVDGVVDHAPGWFPNGARRWYNLIRYSLTTKRTALYRINRKELQVEHLFDLPSHGDTAFPGIVPMEKNEYMLYNYSSPLEGNEDRTWFRGQIGETKIYAQRLRFERKG